jgi:hypothetical protein
VPGYFKSSTWLRTPIASGIMIHVSLGWAAVRRTTIKLMSLGAKPDPKEIMRLSTEGRYLRGKSLEILNNRMRAITDLSNVDDEMIMAVAVFLFFEVCSPASSNGLPCLRACLHSGRLALKKASEISNLTYEHCARSCVTGVARRH